MKRNEGKMTLYNEIMITQDSYLSQLTRFKAVPVQ